MGSARRTELLESAYRYALAHGLADLSLRPLAAAIGSSPRVLLYLFGSKDGLIRELLDRARSDEVALLGTAPAGDLAATTRLIWGWLSDPAHRALLTLWTEAYARSLIEPDGPWSAFARETVGDWLSLLAATQPASTRDTPEAVAERTATLALLRGALLDLLATGDQNRTTTAVLGRAGDS
ncbi:TetR/AcrR family transcriptional regulator [Actinoplanes sp. NPDC049265]|uniref:TetR/AcrR family transcriptional regulator n=1 Tax=Actinoplanes sp. NPDC049265 TaxID=3363902 RepID=UPI00371D5A98